MGFRLAWFVRIFLLFRLVTGVFPAAGGQTAQAAEVQTPSVAIWQFEDIVRVGQHGFTSFSGARAGANGEVVFMGTRSGQTGIYRIVEGQMLEVAIEGMVMPGGTGNLSNIGTSEYKYAVLPNADVLFAARLTGSSQYPDGIYNFRWRNGVISMLNPFTDGQPPRPIIHDLRQVTTDNRWLNYYQVGASFPYTTFFSLGDGTDNLPLIDIETSLAIFPTCVGHGGLVAGVNANNVAAEYHETTTQFNDGAGCFPSMGSTTGWKLRLVGAGSSVLTSGTFIEGNQPASGTRLNTESILFNDQNQAVAIRSVYDVPGAIMPRQQLVIFRLEGEEIIQDTDGPVKTIGLVDFDQNGRVLYGVSLDNDFFSTILLDGPDLTANRIIARGDTLFGQTVTSLGWVYRPAALTDSLDRVFAFDYRLADGAVGIALATLREERLPVIILPGIAGSYAADQSDDFTWLMNRGVHPDGLVVDPLGGFYDDIVLTFEALGYIQGEDLFVANYDWRLPPGPLDGAIDGHVDGLTGAGISDENFLYAVDYLGYYLRQAAEAWRLTHGEPLEKVHVIAHSTGGLVARTYIQSDAYGDLYDDTHHLPTIDHFIMIGVPNRGASKPYNPLQDNWVADPAYQKLLSKIVNRAYVKILAGQTISGPDYDIRLADIRDGNGQPDPVAFVELYVPTLQALLATYDFYSDGGEYHDLNDTNERNAWVLDLNSGLDLGDVPPADPNAFADLCILTVIYGTSEDTKWLTQKLIGPAEDVLSPFSDFFPNDAAVGQPYHLDIAGSQNGDGTVPTISAAGQFFGDPRVTLLPMTAGVTTNFAADHTALVGNLDVQRAILNRLGVPHNLGDIHLGSGASLGSVLSVISDPVQIVLQDGLGRRLGYTDATGKLEEIPGSKWFGTTEGTGWLLGEMIPPLRVTLAGLGEDYYVQVVVNTPAYQGGWSGSGFMALGETLTETIPLRSNGMRVFLPMIRQ